MLKPKAKAREPVPAQTPPSLAVCMTETPYTENPFDVVVAPDKEVWDVKTILAMRPVAQRYTAHLKAHGGQAGSMLSQIQADATERMLATAILYPVVTGEDDVGKDVIDVDGPPIARVQDIMRELKLLDVLFPMVHATATSGLDLENLTPHMSRIHSLVFKAIVHIVQGNRRSEIYFASRRVEQSAESLFAGGNISWIAATIKQVAARPGAARALTTILSNNPELLDKYVDTETIEKFIQLIREQGPQKRFMAFFQAICSCGGNQIISNQELCLSRLVLDARCDS